jgi:hypothetical protein
LKGGSSSLQAVETSDPTAGLSRALADLNLKVVEIEILKKTILEQNEQIKDKEKIIAEYQKLKTKMLTDMEQMKTKLTCKPYFLGAKHLIWDEIISEVTKLWDNFKIIDDEMMLIDEANDCIKKSFHELGTRPQVATQIIKFLNSNSRETLARKGVKDKTTMVMETERIFTKRNLLQQAQNECIALKKNVESFTNKFKNLVKMGLPSAWDKDGKLLSYEGYKEILFISREKDDKFQNMSNNLAGQIIVDLLIDDFYLLWKMKNLFRLHALVITQLHNLVQT